MNNTIEILENEHIEKHSVMNRGVAVTFAEVLHLWRTDEGFRSQFSVTRPFEFVLIDAPEFRKRRTDPDTFADYYTANTSNHGVIAFDNVHRDATLIIPSPRGSISVYGHIASFVRKAPTKQVDALWRIVGETLVDRINNNPGKAFWANTQGDAVAWLHIRFDSTPKYYNFDAYRVNPVTTSRNIATETYGSK